MERRWYLAIISSLTYGNWPQTAVNSWEDSQFALTDPVPGGTQSIAVCTDNLLAVITSRLNRPFLKVMFRSQQFFFRTSL